MALLKPVFMESWENYKNWDREANYFSVPQEAFSWYQCLYMTDQSKQNHQQEDWQFFYNWLPRWTSPATLVWNIFFCCLLSYAFICWWAELNALCGFAGLDCSTCCTINCCFLFIKLAQGRQHILQHFRPRLNAVKPKLRAVAGVSLWKLACIFIFYFQAEITFRVLGRSTRAAREKKALHMSSQRGQSQTSA